jgi:cytochrome c oxidase cbb3-type subunit III
MAWSKASMNSFWNLWIIGLTALTLVGILWLLLANRKTEKKSDDNKTGHEYDGIEEYDNPLPAWWMHMFILTIIFSVAYLVAYPGMGNFKGMLGWTQLQQYDNEMQKADAEFLAVYKALVNSQHGDSSITALASNEKAVKMGQRLFSTNCTVCHGADAGGARGYPNLRDNDWLYGGTGEDIKTTITHGRQAMMPAWGAVFGNNQAGEKKIADVAAYVKALSENRQDETSFTAGKEIFSTYCVACHGANGEGNTMVGAPRLNDKIWLYGGSMETIEKTIREGRAGKMPAHADVLSEERIQLLAAYVYSLSHSANRP